MVKEAWRPYEIRIEGHLVPHRPRQRDSNADTGAAEQQAKESER
jgi:hypothetical protein